MQQRVRDPSDGKFKFVRMDIPEDVLRWHLEAGLSYRKIGRLLGCDSSVVSRRVAEYSLAKERADVEDGDVEYEGFLATEAMLVAFSGRRFMDDPAALIDLGSTGRLPPRTEYSSGCGNSSEMCAVRGEASW